MKLWRKTAILLAALALGLSLNSCVFINGSATLSAEQDFRNHNYVRAFEKLWLPANNGVPRAQYALGYMYYYGLGTVRDQDFARLWFKHAARSNYPPAVKAYRLMTNPVHQQIIPMQKMSVRTVVDTKRFNDEGNKVNQSMNYRPIRSEVNSEVNKAKLPAGDKVKISKANKAKISKTVEVKTLPANKARMSQE